MGTFAAGPPPPEPMFPQGSIPSTLSGDEVGQNRMREVPYPEKTINLLLPAGQDAPTGPSSSLDVGQRLPLFLVSLPQSQSSFQFNQFSPFQTCLPPAILILIPGSHWKQRITHANVHMTKDFRYFFVFIYSVIFSRSGLRRHLSRLPLSQRRRFPRR